MSMMIRLTRRGRKKRPSYRLVVTEKRTARDGQPVAVLGHYDPAAAAAGVKIDAEATRAWIAKGVPASPAAQRLLKRAGLVVEGAPAKA